jgi:hypothetical protein
MHWGQRERIAYKQSAWYDHTFYRVPVTMKDGHPLDHTACNRMHDVWRKRLGAGAENARLGKFGGWTSMGTIKVDEEHPGHVVVEMIYHIGD